MNVDKEPRDSSPVRSRLANQYIQGFSKDEDRDWQKLADILLLRIILSLQHTLNRQQEGAAGKGGERGGIARTHMSVYWCEQSSLAGR